MGSRRAVLLTGGGSGIGRATALLLAEQGAEVMVLECRRGPLAATVDLHADIQGLVGDVSSAADAERAVRATVDAFGGIDALVNNAGIIYLTPLPDTTTERAWRLWEINVLGPTLLVQAALPELVRSQGAVVNVSSCLGHRPAPGVTQYAATKAAVEQLTRSWALELAGRGVRVNAVAPGPTESEALLGTGLPAEEIERIKEMEREMIPLGRRGEPADVARWIAALVDPAATWTTGQVIDVDGGFSIA